MYFDLGQREPAYDADAKGMVVKLDKRLRGSAVPTPDVFAATAGGEKLGVVSNYASEDQVLTMMRQVVQGNPDLMAEHADEAKRRAEARSWLRYCIGDTQGARDRLTAPKEPAQALMLARIERWEGHLEAARSALSASKTVASGDRTLELGKIELADENFEEALAAFEAVPHDHAGRSEADYHRGVAMFHLGHKQVARSVWLALIQRFGEDRWSYRADWALAGSNDKKQRRTSFSTTGSKSALGRHGYIGRSNPDLAPVSER